MPDNRRQDTQEIDPELQENLVDASREADLASVIVEDYQGQVHPSDPQRPPVPLPGVTDYNSQYQENNMNSNPFEASPMTLGEEAVPPMQDEEFQRQSVVQGLPPMPPPAKSGLTSIKAMLVMALLGLAIIIGLLLWGQYRNEMVASDISSVKLVVNDVKSDTSKLTDMDSKLDTVVKATGEDGVVFGEQKKINKLLTSKSECKSEQDKRLNDFLTWQEKRRDNLRANYLARKRARQNERKRQEDLMAAVKNIQADVVVVKSDTNIIRNGVGDLNRRPGPVVNLSARLDESGKLVITEGR